MADSDDSTDESQKTEEPTARKLEEARKRGQIVSSKEVNNWFILFTATLVVVIAGPPMMSSLSDAFTIFLSQPHNLPVEGKQLGQTVHSLFFKVLGIVVLPLLLLSIAVAVAGFIQSGPLFTLDPLKPDLSKISIIKGFSRLFSLRSIMELVKGIFKMAIISIVSYIVLSPYFDSIEHFVGLDFGQTMFDLEEIFIRLMIGVLSILFIMAVMDYTYQRFEFMKSMRMSKQELREEFKQSEGDPQIKAKLRAIREQKARQRMMQAVPEADVVITNPTHYAVALKYDTAEMDAPMMVAKGVDAVAQRIKEVAKENKVPIVENPTLARALFDSMEIEQSIPREHFKAVAEVISYVFKLKRKKL